MPVVWGILFSIVIQFTLLLHKQNIIVADIYHLPAIICLPYLKYCHLRTQDHSSRSCSLWTQVYTHLTNCCHQPGTAKEKHRFTLPKHVAWNNKTCGMEQQNMWHGTTKHVAWNNKLHSIVFIHVLQWRPLLEHKRKGLWSVLTSTQRKSVQQDRRI